ncbi:MAG: AhpC/TSA family protein [Flavobacteriaceae bacterium]|nr:AhpC/TSA family protein [Flavobacteriaceae bacterium]
MRFFGLGLIVLSILISSCAEKVDGYLLTGEFTGDLEDGTAVYLKAMNELNRLVEVDTAYLEAGAFQFAGKTEAPELHYLFIDQTRGNIPVVLEDGKIEVNAQKDSLAFASVEGTLQNEYFQDYLKHSRVISLKVASIQLDASTASAAKDTAVVSSLRDEYLELQNEARDYEVEFIKGQPDALISLLLLERVNAGKTIPETEVLELFNALSPELQSNTIGTKLKATLERGAKVAIGAQAPNFSAPTPGGQQLSLNEALGKVTIVDFWAAWCKPCRAENPNLVRVYEKHKDKGLSIIGVSLDRKAEDWIKAIEVDNLTWHQVSNVRYFDEIAALYNVRAIPASFILDENGVIVAKNLRGNALAEKISELLP